MNSDILTALNALEQKVYRLELELTMLRNAFRRQLSHDHCPYNPDNFRLFRIIMF